MGTVFERKVSTQEENHEHVSRLKTLTYMVEKLKEELSTKEALLMQGKRCKPTRMMIPSRSTSLTLSLSFHSRSEAAVGTGYGPHETIRRGAQKG